MLFRSLYNGPELDSLSQHDWDSMSDSQLYNYYSFQDSDLVLYQGPKVTDRILKHRFTKEGHYLVVTQWYNKCLNQDTFTLTRLTVDLCTTSGVVTLIKPAPKLIGIYDMMGRQVDYMRSNEIYIMRFDNGQSRKIMRVER